MGIIINPGCGKIDNASEENAIVNIRHFVADLQDDKIKIIRYKEKDYNTEYDDGRYCFLLKKDNFVYEIQMPGLPLENVRWMNATQNIWDFPRLYIDGSSWIWGIGLGLCTFKKEED